MPKLTDASRDARRAEIADSVIRVMRRVGFARLSMAEVFAESGLSAGSVYSHFSGKEDLAAFVLRRTHDDLVDDLLDFTRAQSVAGTVLVPAALTRWLIERLKTTGAIFPAMVQSYAESAVDSALRTAARESVASLRDALRLALHPWAATAEGGGTVEGATMEGDAVDGVLAGGAVDEGPVDDGAEADGHDGALPERRHIDLAPVVEGVLIVCGGYVSRSAMYGDIDTDRYLEAVRLAAGATGADGPVSTGWSDRPWTRLDEFSPGSG